MADDEQLDHVISILYETVVDPCRWQYAIKLCGQYAGGVNAHLLTVNKQTNTPIASILGGAELTQQNATDHVNHYMPIDPRINFFLSGSVNEWICCKRFYDRSFNNSSVASS